MGAVRMVKYIEDIYSASKHNILLCELILITAPNMI